MSHSYLELFFTKAVQDYQQQKGSHHAYAHYIRKQRHQGALTDNEKQFISDRDSFYIATISESGWPYLQHRGGPRGFVKVIDDHTIGYADYAGNRQYITSGNLTTNHRISLIFMDYPNQARLKVAGTMQLVDDSNWSLMAELEPTDYPAVVERGYVITVTGYDWNCPRHIPRRYTAEEFEEHFKPSNKQG